MALGGRLKGLAAGVKEHIFTSKILIKRTRILTRRTLMFNEHEKYCSPAFPQPKA
jgi:hypothetical protein